MRVRPRGTGDCCQSAILDKLKYVMSRIDSMVTAVRVNGTTKYPDGDGVVDLGTIEGGGDAVWGEITGTLADQTDLKDALDAKADSADLATVATTGDYDDLIDKPTIPAAQIQSDWAQADNTALDYIKNKPSLATVATTGDYDDLTDKPTIPVLQASTGQSNTDGMTQKAITDALDTKFTKRTSGGNCVYGYYAQQQHYYEATYGPSSNTLVIRDTPGDTVRTGDPSYYPDSAIPRSYCETKMALKADKRVITTTFADADVLLTAIYELDVGDEVVIDGLLDDDYEWVIENAHFIKVSSNKLIGSGTCHYGSSGGMIQYATIMSDNKLYAYWSQTGLSPTSRLFYMGALRNDAIAMTIKY